MFTKPLIFSASLYKDSSASFKIESKAFCGLSVQHWNQPMATFKVLEALKMRQM